MSMLGGQLAPDVRMPEREDPNADDVCTEDLFLLLKPGYTRKLTSRTNTTRRYTPTLGNATNGV